MSTIKKRLNITLAKPLNAALTKVAERDHIPMSAKASALLALALEIEEDTVWDAVAGVRDTDKARFLSHKKSWI